MKSLLKALGLRSEKNKFEKNLDIGNVDEVKEKSDVVKELTEALQLKDSKRVDDILTKHKDYIKGLPPMGKPSISLFDDMLVEAASKQNNKLVKEIFSVHKPTPFGCYNVLEAAIKPIIEKQDISEEKTEQIVGIVTLLVDNGLNLNEIYKSEENIQMTVGEYVNQYDEKGILRELLIPETVKYIKNSYYYYKDPLGNVVKELTEALQLKDSKKVYDILTEHKDYIKGLPIEEKPRAIFFAKMLANAAGEHNCGVMKLILEVENPLNVNPIDKTSLSTLEQLMQPFEKGEKSLKDNVNNVKEILDLLVKNQLNLKNRVYKNKKGDMLLTAAEYVAQYDPGKLLGSILGNISKPVTRNFCGYGGVPSTEPNPGGNRYGTKELKRRGSSGYNTLSGWESKSEEDLGNSPEKGMITSDIMAPIHELLKTDKTNMHYGEKEFYTNVCMAMVDYIKNPQDPINFWFLGRNFEDAIDSNSNQHKDLFSKAYDVIQSDEFKSEIQKLKESYQGNLAGLSKAVFGDAVQNLFETQHYK